MIDLSPWLKDSKYPVHEEITDLISRYSANLAFGNSQVSGRSDSQNTIPPICPACLLLFNCVNIVQIVVLNP